jgi:hypothetical protein
VLTTTDRYIWSVLYRDGTHAGEKWLGTFAEVEADRVAEIELSPTRGLIRKTIKVEIPLGKRAVFFRRRRRTALLNPDATVIDGTVTVVGWEGVGGGRYWAYPDRGKAFETCDLREI